MKRHAESLIEILKDRPHEVGCEVGVYKGITTSSLLNSLNGINRYYVVDPWEDYKGYEKLGHDKTKWNKAVRQFFENTYDFKSKVIIMRMMSNEAVKHIKDESLDWVFIDANHKYEFIEENINIWVPKVKVGGVVSGHDYKNPKEKKRGWGITRAVKEMVPKEKLNTSPGMVWWFIK